MQTIENPEPVDTIGRANRIPNHNWVALRCCYARDESEECSLESPIRVLTSTSTRWTWTAIMLTELGNPKGE